MPVEEEALPWVQSAAEAENDEPEFVIVDMEMYPLEEHPAYAENPQAFSRRALEPEAELLPDLYWFELFTREEQPFPLDTRTYLYAELGNIGNDEVYVTASDIGFTWDLTKSYTADPEMSPSFIMPGGFYIIIRIQVSSVLYQDNPGRHLVTLRANRNGRIQESDYTNNTISESFVWGSESPTPDLQAVAWTPTESSHRKVNQPLEYDFLMTIAGTTVTNPEVAIYVDNALIYSGHFTGTYGPGHYHTNVTLTGLSDPGYYNIRILLDPNNKVQEENKANNGIVDRVFLYQHKHIAYWPATESIDLALLIDPNDTVYKSKIEESLEVWNTAGIGLSVTNNLASRNYLYLDHIDDSYLGINHSWRASLSNNDFDYFYIVINDYAIDQLPHRDDYIIAVGVHEIGHSFGFIDNPPIWDNHTSIMRYTQSRYDYPVKYPTEFDKAYAREWFDTPLSRDDYAILPSLTVTSTDIFEASWLEYENVESLLLSSDVVFRIRVTVSYEDVYTSGRGYEYPYTYSQANILGTLYGNTDDNRITIKQIGFMNTAPCIDIEYLEKDGEYIVFLNKRDDGTYTLVNASQAIYPSNTIRTLQDISFGSE